MDATISRHCALSTSLFPPQSIDDLFHQIADRLSASAALRMAWQAMIATPVRKTNRLIALLTHAHAPSSAHNSKGLMFSGLSEDDPPRFDNGAGSRRVSAGKNPQSCGKGSALVFDVAGLIGWLKARFPRSTDHHVSADTGIPAASVENWLHRRSQPSVQHFSILLKVYGPSLLAASFKSPPGWVDEAARSERRREIEAQIARLERERTTIGGAA